MIKISDALDKAGYGQGIEQNPGKPAQEKEDGANKASVPPEPRPGRKISEHRQLELNGKWDPRLFKAVNKDAALPEIFKALRSRILHPLEEQSPPKNIMITSAIAGEGKSFIAANLAIAFAHGVDQHCLLVDCDLRRPSIATLFGLENGPGLADFLRDETPLEKLIVKTSVQTLSVLPSGVPPANPAELLSSARMAALVQELTARYDDRIIIFDTPPLMAAESTVLAGQVDAVILVVRQSCSGRTQIQKTLDVLDPDKVLGVVFNGQQIAPLQESLVKGYGSYLGAYYR